MNKNTLTIKQLIELFKEFDPNAGVMLVGCHCITSVVKVGAYGDKFIILSRLKNIIDNHNPHE